MAVAVIHDVKACKCMHVCMHACIYVRLYKHMLRPARVCMCMCESMPAVVMDDMYRMILIYFSGKILCTYVRMHGASPART